VCIPDLELVHQDTGRSVFVEVMGFWSRDAVWRRIELAEAGLPVPLVFAVSKHLRVSEAALPAELPAALYVYARTMSATALLERVDSVTVRLSDS
jgi:predicted nuclease of restriction endonuclease-like RecB superfamily